VTILNLHKLVNYPVERIDSVCKVAFENLLYLSFKILNNW